MASIVFTFTNCTKQKNVYPTIFEGLLLFVNLCHISTAWVPLGHFNPKRHDFTTVG
jgi:hypothetical protein